MANPQDNAAPQVLEQTRLKRMSARLVLAGRPGVRSTTVSMWARYGELIHTSWSRTNLERRGKVGVRWTAARIITPFMHYAIAVLKLTFTFDPFRPPPRLHPRTLSSINPESA
jgi:hypothetical protein